ncbi:MAG TPA: hypothetical protein VGF92_15065 [Stellaceae bacterium]|jgi:hypothetical protein
MNPIRVKVILHPKRVCYISNMARKPMKPDKPVELHPDAWERFEKAMTTIGKAKPIHRPAKDRPPPKRGPRPRAKS